MDEIKIAVIGLGYVGLPLARLFATKYAVVGFDVNKERIAELMSGKDATLEISEDVLKSVLVDNRHVGKGLFCSASIEDIKNSNYYVVTVPTPVDKKNRPVLTPLIKASETVGSVLKHGDIVVYESTVYPGATEEDCVPVLEKISRLKFNKDFYAGYSPERINPGDKEHTIEKILKVTSGSTPEIGRKIDDLYRSVITAGTHLAPTIKVAEAAKVIENSQRDINIALMNELSMIFEKVGIRTQDVLDAAGTKWNFLKFYPGLVGGHCIGVDPYYLVHKANELGVNARLIAASRAVNDNMPQHVANRIAKQLREDGIANMDAKVLVRGITFKEDVQDIRNSKAAEMVQQLKSMGINVTVEDPNAVPAEVMHEYGIETTANPTGEFDCIVLAVPHKQFNEDTVDKYMAMSSAQPFIFDFRNTIKNVPRGVVYMTL